MSLALALGALAGGATAASAEPKCHSSTSQSIACLNISHRGGGVYEVGVTINVVMPIGEAQRILAQPGDAFTTWLVADDPGANDQALVPLPSLSESVSITGVFGALGRDVGFSVVNEDSDGTDELYARVFLFDRETGTTREFTTGVVAVNF